MDAETILKTIFRVISQVNRMTNTERVTLKVLSAFSKGNFLKWSENKVVEFRNQVFDICVFK